MFSVNFHLEIKNPEECTTLENEFAEELRDKNKIVDKMIFLPL